MKKLKELFVINIVLVVFVVLTVVLCFCGIKNSDNNYIKISSNAPVEFITNKKGKIISVYSNSEKGKIILCDEKFKGMQITDAINKYLNIAYQLNYLDCDNKNIIELGVVFGITNILEVKLYKIINKFLLNNEIMGTIVESKNILKNQKDAKKFGVSCYKLQLMQSLTNFKGNYDLNKIKNMHEYELINKLKNCFNNQNNNENKNNNIKQKLINDNVGKIEKHKSLINKKTLKEFKQNYVSYNKYNLHRIEKELI